MQRVRSLGSNGNVFELEEKAVLRRNVFTMEGHGKGNGVPCISEDDKAQEEVMKFKGFIMNGGCQYIE
jgi:hypothetical protein